MLPQIFRYEEKPVRTISRDGEPWFVAKDVAEILGYVDTAQAVRMHCKGVVETTTPTPGGLQTIKIIPERDIYRLVMKSRLPAAEKFEEWVVGEVLPAIRKTGSYAVQQYKMPTTFGEALMLAAQTQLENEHLTIVNATQAKAIIEHAPVKEAYDTLIESSALYTMGDTSKFVEAKYITGRNRFIAMLKELGIILSDGSGRQEWIANGWLVPKIKIENGYAHKVLLVSSSGLAKIWHKIDSGEWPLPLKKEKKKRIKHELQ